MIQSFIASTREIDDPDAAVAEIIAQLDMEHNLLKNSMGIISCFSEFVDTGALAAISAALPFDCIGATTCMCAGGADVDQILLTVTVLTSDDCSFVTTALPLAEDYAQVIQSGVSALLASAQERPAMILSYFPLINSISGDMILTEIDKTTGGIPLFGTTAIDHMPDYSTSQTIRNGQAFRTSVVLGAIYGAVDFSFSLTALDERKIRRQKAIITESSGNLLIGVNGKSALEYLEEIGLTEAELATGLGVIPLTVDHMDGTKPVARAVFALTPEGHAICGGAMPVNATLAVGRVDRADVLDTTEQSLRTFLAPNSTILSYSCIARYLILGAHTTAEAEKVSELSGDVRYLFAYSGGEICPLPDAEGKLRNFYHNYTIAFCRLS